LDCIIKVYTFTAMITEIDNYRGHEIRFDTDSETFVCDIDDSRSIKKSYSALKAFIDSWIKDNSEFVPFLVAKTPNGYGCVDSDSDGKIIGIRKDGRFILEKADGKKEQISDYQLDRYMLVEKDNDAIKLAIDALNLEIKAKQSEISSLTQKLKVTTLKDLWPKYKPV